MVRALFAILLMLALSTAGPSPAPAQALPGEADQATIRGVIADQLAAFQRDDGPAAFAFASPFIQQKFGTPEIFMQMVRTGYQPVYRPREVQFRELVTEGGRLYQKVYIVGPDGQPVLALYEMQRQPDGSWRINGCILTKSPDLSV
jgi:hypothetical protein